MSSAKPLSDIKYFQHFLRYTKTTSKIYWKQSPRYKISVGDEAGSLDVNGYRNIRLKGQSYKAHRLAWLLVYGVGPDADIDHKNNKTDDNRISSLRLATRQQNSANTAKTCSTSGHRGVSFHKASGKYSARIKKDQTSFNLGLFQTAREAYRAYFVASGELFGEFGINGGKKCL